MEVSIGELIYYAHELGDFDDIDYLVISDAHYGNHLYSEKHFKRTLEFLKRPNAFAFLEGDLCECVTRNSKGEIHKQVGSPDDQADYMIELLEPYKDKILGICTGNHEARIEDVDISKKIARAIGVPYRPEGMMLKISFGGGNEGHQNKPYVFWHYGTHGYGGARTKSAKAIKVERLSGWINADLFTMSHDHVVNVAPDILLEKDNRTFKEMRNGKYTGFTYGRLKAKRRMLVKTNAYLKWGGYSEMGGFPPTDLDTPVIRLLTPHSKRWKDLPDRPHQAIKVEA